MGTAPTEVQWQHRTVDCVECPDCLFTFAAIHTHEDGTYSCPNCPSDTAIANERERCAGIEFATARDMGSFAVVEVGNLGIKLYQDIDDATALAESINLQIQCAIREGKS